MPARCTCFCLQLPSRLEVLTRLRQEKAEAAALKQDPLNTFVDAKSESLARLQALRQQQAPKAAPGSMQQQQQDAEPDGGSRPAAAGAGDGSNGAAAVVAADAGGSDEDEDAAAADGEGGGGGDPYAGMNPRQRKLYELKQKMQQARKANENAIIAERKRMRVSRWLLVACAVDAPYSPPGWAWFCTCRHVKAAAVIKS